MLLNLSYDAPSETKSKEKSSSKEKLKKRKSDVENATVENNVSKKKKIKASDCKQKGTGVAALVRDATCKNDNKIEAPEVTPIGGKLFSGVLFSKSAIHPYLTDNLKQSWNIVEMTEVQKRCSEPLLAGKDALVRWQTGSGKTIAYAVPLIQRLANITPQITRADGIKAFVVLPTRELAIQTYEIFLVLVKSFARLVAGCLVGGEKRKSEKARLRKGLTIVIGTPGRLLDHATNTQSMSLAGVDTLIIDEADRMIDLGYQQHITELIKIIENQRGDRPGIRQTVLLSATLTSGVERLAGLALTSPERILDGSEEDGTFSGDINLSIAMPATLKQEYLVTPARLRLVTLTALIVNYIKEEKCGKMLVFMATLGMVDYHERILPIICPVTKYFKLHGSMTQLDRSEVFNKFRKSESGVLIATDVAGRGIDVPNVGAIIQYTGPCDVADYVHRVGRTARSGHAGSATLVLAPSEANFISMLADKSISVGERNLGKLLESLYYLKFDDKKPRDLEDAATMLQLKFEQAVLEDKELHGLASEGFKSFIKFYATYPRESRVAYNFKSLHLGHYAKSFALRDPPSEVVSKRMKETDKKGFNKKIGPEKHQMRPKVDKHKQSHGMKNDAWSSVSEYDSGLKPMSKKGGGKK